MIEQAGRCPRIKVYHIAISIMRLWLICEAAIKKYPMLMAVNYARL
jgi:hypothetical protein